MDHSSVEGDEEDWSFITNSFAAAATKPPSQPQPHDGQTALGYVSPGTSTVAADPIAFRRLSLDNPPPTAAATSRSNAFPQPNVPPPIPRLSDSGAHGLPPSAPRISRSLSEFTGMAVRHGIFRPPTRASVHQERPPSIELRPHPLRESQVGCFIRTIAGSTSQIWAGTENGVRVWNLSDVFEGFGRGGFASWKPERGDEESVPFRESSFTYPTIFLVVDSDRGFVWSGHKDGRIRIWRVEQPESKNSAPERGNLAECFSWQAHRSPVLSMAITSHGDCHSQTFIFLVPFPFLLTRINLLFH
ncbi:hypothetical protein GW17_00026033 [Ensete ventricosum]|nr:hypothetical protein GW17_00026033 [Ensete ventricosum]